MQLMMERKKRMNVMRSKRKTRKRRRKRRRMALTCLSSLFLVFFKKKRHTLVFSTSCIFVYSAYLWHFSHSQESYSGRFSNIMRNRRYINDLVYIYMCLPVSQIKDLIVKVLLVSDAVIQSSPRGCYFQVPFTISIICLDYRYVNIKVYECIHRILKYRMFMSASFLCVTVPVAVWNCCWLVTPLQIYNTTQQMYFSKISVPH